MAEYLNMQELGTGDSAKFTVAAVMRMAESLQRRHSWLPIRTQKIVSEEKYACFPSSITHAS
jgi:hypothetical protein